MFLRFSQKNINCDSVNIDESEKKIKKVKTITDVIPIKISCPLFFKLK